MPVIREPVRRPTARLLRRAVLDLATHERRRRFPARLHVGLPGSSEVAVTHDPRLDRGVRADLLAAALDWQTGDHGLPWVWLTRPGTLDLTDLPDADADWLAPALAVGAERGADVTFVVVTRHGWLDPRSGATRHWRRLRGRPVARNS